MFRVAVFIIVSLLAHSTWAQDPFLALFSKSKPMIAALMIEKDLSSEEKIQNAIRWGQEQIRVAETHGMDGILFEFRGGKIMQPVITEQKFQAMKRVAKALVKGSQKLVVGVEILWHYPQETLRLAKESGARFVRVDFFSDEVIADKKNVPLDPQGLIAYKKKIGADGVFLLTDIQVKYSKMVDPKIPLDVSAKKAIAQGSQGVIVTSTQSGRAPEPTRPRLAQKGAGTKPVLIGSGFSYKNVNELLPHADAVIVGTSISEKTGGPLVPSKVKQLMAAVNQFRQQAKGSRSVTK